MKPTHPNTPDFPVSARPAAPAGRSPPARANTRRPDRQAHTVRRPPPAKFGAIDVGTNSIHLVMAEISPEGDFRILGRDKEMVQLGKGGFARHILTDRAIAGGLDTLKRFIKMAQLKGVTRLRAVATSAVREARNGGDFVNRVREDLGLELHVISAEEEARLIYLAVRHAVELGDRDNLIIDIGGGSVELAVGNAARHSVLGSAKLGALRLAELFLRHDPPALDDLNTLRRHIERELDGLARRVGSRPLARCIVTSGAVQNIAAICAARQGGAGAVAQPVIHEDELTSLLAELSPMNREQRLRVPGIEARRVDVVLPAATLLLNIMRVFGVPEAACCGMALREGIILDDISRHRVHLAARASWPDARTRSVLQLAERCGYGQAHAEQVARLALSLYEQLQELHQLDEQYRDLLRHACLLHDIGYFLSHADHHKHAYYLIRNGGLQGFDGQEIEIIANIARYHRKGAPKKSHSSYQNLARQHRAAVRKLAALLRLANALDRTHYSVVESVRCRKGPGGMELLVVTDQDAELELWTARREKALFEREFHRRLDLVLAGSSAATEARAEREATA